MRFYYVYLLKSLANDKFYVGFSTDVELRLRKHNSGRVTSTKSGVPYELLYFEAYRNKKDALIREKKLKHHGQGIRRLKERLKYDLEN